MSSSEVPRSLATVFAFGHVYAASFDKNDLDALFRLAITSRINYENRLSLLTWLKDSNNIPAYRFVSSVEDHDWKILIENFKRKSLQAGRDIETKLTTQDKPPTYDDTPPGDAYTPESPAAQMVPRDPAFRTLTKQYLGKDT